ncbi:MAG: hypothetical protein H0V82_02815 [Candidatus Protochlamydia sp.]|nr:hypothetical protein [Candidatus Protochlamydia sp.]
MPFLTAPTSQQRTEIEMLCNKGLSDSYLKCYIQAPLQAITAVAAAALDIPGEPLRGCYHAAVCVFKGELINGTKAIFSGVINAGRSLVQIAMIVMAVACGIVFPRLSYSALKYLYPAQARSAADLITTLEHAEARLDAQQSQINGKEQRINFLQAEIARLGDEKIAAENKLRSNHMSLKEQIVARDLKILTLSSELTQFTENARIVEETAKNEIEQLKAEKILKEKAVEDLERQLRSKDAQTGANESLKTEKINLMSEISQLKEEIKANEETLRQEIERSKLEALNYENALQQLKSQAESLRLEKSNLEKANDQLKEEIKADEETLRQEIEKSKEGIVQYENEVQQLKSQVETLRLEKSNVEKANDQLKEEIKADEEILSQEIEKSKIEAVKYDSTFQQLKSQVETLKLANTDLENTNNEKKVQFDSLIKTEKEKTAQLQSRFDAKIKKDLAEKAELIEENKNLRSSNVNLNKTVSQGLPKFQENIDTIKKLKLEIKELKSKPSQNQLMEAEERIKQFESENTRLKEAINEKEKLFFQQTEIYKNTLLENEKEKLELINRIPKIIHNQPLESSDDERIKQMETENSKLKKAFDEKEKTLLEQAELNRELKEKLQESEKEKVELDKINHKLNETNKKLNTIVSQATKVVQKDKLEKNKTLAIKNTKSQTNKKADQQASMTEKK